MKQYHDLPRSERAALARIADAETQEERDEALSAYCLIRDTKRLYQRRRGDDDRWKRTMLAVHVPFSYAQAVRTRAEAEKISVYQWLRRAIDAAMR